MRLKQEKIFRWLNIEFLKNCKNSKFCTTASLPASLPDHIRKLRCQMKHHTAANLRHNNKLTSEMCLLGYQRVWGLCAPLFFSSSIRLFFFFFFMQRNHINLLIFQSTVFSSSVSRCHNVNFKALVLL